MLTLFCAQNQPYVGISSLKKKNLFFSPLYFFSGGRGANGRSERASIKYKETLNHMLKLWELNVTLGIGVAAGEGKCHVLSLESTLGNGYDESSVPISKGRFTVTILSLSFRTLTCMGWFQSLGRSPSQYVHIDLHFCTFCTLRSITSTINIGSFYSNLSFIHPVIHIHINPASGVVTSLGILQHSKGELSWKYI